MASISLQMHETPWPCSLAPACRLYTFCNRRFSTTEKLQSNAFMINKHFMKKKTSFQEKTSEKSPILPWPPFFSLFSTLLSLSFAVCCNGLSMILSLSSKALLTHILSLLFQGLFLVSHVPPPHPLICTLSVPLLISQPIY